MPRFHCPVPLQTGELMALPAGAARHVQVLRMQPGGVITLFNGTLKGGEFEATITHMGRSDVQVQVGADLGARMAHALETTLATASAALLIGTDCPVLGAGEYGAAVAALRTHDGVFVPVEDGGYALVGACASALPLLLSQPELPAKPANVVTTPFGVTFRIVLLPESAT